jgi:serine-type D-Ala-D-Ala carboxypeptidase/endopeptidase (penicillin-binding protein 4)
MKKVFLFIGCWLLIAGSSAQTVTQKLQKAFQQFETDSQLKHAISSLYVIDAKTGQVVFDKNAQVGLAPASTQKIITSVTAFELLGRDYRYKTFFTFQHFGGFDHRLVVYASGDPTFGSQRFSTTKESIIFDTLINLIKKKYDSFINDISVSITGDSKQIPSGWIFEDIGNYYGAASHDLNWKENQYDFTFSSGKKVRDPADMISYDKQPWLSKYIDNQCKTGPAGSGDNAYIYFIPGTKGVLIRGTIPLGVNKFTISGADFEPPTHFSFSLEDYAISKGIKVSQKDIGRFPLWENVGIPGLSIDSSYMKTAFYTHYSPFLDSIIYWFLKKSINLYGEALIKTFAYEKQGFGSTDSGVSIVKKFWKDKGLDDEELNIYDGSGLSPLNRVTTHAQVEILKYAKTKDWFQYFYNSLPDYNGMRMKSGTISDVKGFCGYHKAKDGKEYIFSFLVNNYSGKTSSVVNKMYKVLDELK